MPKRILHNENLSHQLRLLLTGHEVSRVSPKVRGEIHGDLVALAEEAGFEVLVTVGQNLSYQQNMQGRKLALVVLSSNRARRF